MFNDATKALKKERKRVLKEYKEAIKSGLYSGWDIGNIEPSSVKYKDAVYRVKPVWTRVIDEYDEYLECAELSHRENLGLSTVTSAFCDSGILDFRFIKPQDNISLKISNKIKIIYLNSVNIRYSFFKGNMKFKFDISKNTDIIDFAISLYCFMKNNKELIDSINFQNIEDKVQKNIIKMVCNKHQFDNVSFVTIYENKEEAGKSRVRRNI